MMPSGKDGGAGTSKGAKRASSQSPTTEAAVSAVFQRRGLVPRPPETDVRHFSCRCQGFRLGFYGPHEILNGIHFLLFEIRLSALLAHPSWNGIKHQVTTFAVDMKRRCGPPHLALAMDAFHLFTLTLKSSDHSCSSGSYMSNYGTYQKHLCDMPFLHQAPPGSGWIWTIRSEMARCK